MNLTAFEEMSEKETKEFSRICNMLLSVTYILRDGADGRISKEYHFIDSHFELFSDYLELIGWKIYKDIQYGIIYVRNVDGLNKLTLNKLTSVMLVAIRIIYEESRIKASNTSNVCITVGSLFDKIVNEFSMYSKKPPQKEIKESFRILEAHNLIKRLDDSFDDIECRFVILPSVLIAVSNEKSKAICDTLKSKSEEITNEEIDPTAVD